MTPDLARFEVAICGIRAPRTAATYVRVVSAFLATHDADAEPTSRDVESFLARKSRIGYRRAPSTRNQELAALRALAKFAVGEQVWTKDPTLGIAFARVPIQDAAFFTMGEVRRLFFAAFADHSPMPRARNVALLALLSQAGLRVHEVVGLDRRQVDLEQETLVGIRGKGDTLANIPISPEVAVVLARWLSERATIAHSSEEALFVSRLGRRLSIRSVERVVGRLREKAGIAKLGSCHALRHSMATISLELGSDIGTISEILRHSSIAVTQRYVHCLDGRRRDAVRRLATTIPKAVVAGTEQRTEEPQPPAMTYPEKVIDDQYVWDDAA